ncbi:MAG: DUF4868 domain-containing protein [Bacteroidetes bacterium]|nr:DUF4868 domain-containing protein [Bacteroidota bacterium]
MTKEELNENISFLFGENPIGIKLYFVVENGGEMQIRFADISDEVAIDLKEQFINYIRGKFVNNPELVYAEITEADDTSNAAYHYNLEGEPEELSPLFHANENDDYPTFSFTNDDLKGIKAFIIRLGNETAEVLLYKKHYPISLMKRGSYYGLVPSDNRLEKFSENLIKINNSVEFMIVDDELIILSIDTFQNSFGYDKIIRSKAADNLQIIQDTNILEDVNALTELATELKYAKKIMKIRHHSPVLNIPFPEIKNFIQNHPKLKRRIRFNATETRISLESRASKELFIKILNDDFLKSELTQLLYDSQKKAALDNGEEPAG